MNWESLKSFYRTFYWKKGLRGNLSLQVVAEKSEESTLKLQIWSGGQSLAYFCFVTKWSWVNLFNFCDAG